MKFTKNNALRFAAGAAAFAATAVLSATPASATTLAAPGPGKLKVCSSPSYTTYVVFLDNPGRSTPLVGKGACPTFGGFGTSNTVEAIQVRGFYNNSRNDFYVKNGAFRPSAGGTVISYGTDTGRHWALTPRT